MVEKRLDMLRTSSKSVKHEESFKNESREIHSMRDEK